MRLIIKKKNDAWFGYINGQYFDRWYNETEKDLFVNSFKRMATVLHDNNWMVLYEYC